MILIFKSARRLEYREKDRLLFSCPICLGSQPEGHKLSEGDGRTPEGDYRVCTVNRESKFHLALGISYPSVRDARAARKAGRIGLIDYLRIAVPSLVRLRPGWHTPLGGCIMIHGRPDYPVSGDWTKGCIALSDADIEALAALAPKGTRVRILP